MARFPMQEQISVSSQQTRQTPEKAAIRRDRCLCGYLGAFVSATLSHKEHFGAGGGQVESTKSSTVVKTEAGAPSWRARV